MSVDSPSEPATVLVNLLWLVPGVVGGSEDSLTDALRGIAATAPDDLQLRLAVLEPFAAAHPDLADAFPLEVLADDGTNKARRVLAEQTWLVRTARRLDARVVHHAGGTVPIAHPGRVVLTIQDLQPLDLPRNFSLAKRSYLTTMLGRSARAADVVQVPSEFTRERVVALLGVDPGRVCVVPWSTRPPADDGPIDLSAARAGGVVPDVPYLLYPAITYPHKNHRVLLDAAARLEGVGAESVLVLTGGAAGAEPEVAERIDALGLTDRVWRTGRVSAERLDALYAGACGVLVPSRYEGFGLPALEAMQRGCPVAVARSGSLPEVVGEESLVDPDDVTAWTDAMQSLLSMSEADRSARVARGHELAARFGRERTAAGLLDAYRSALARPPSSS
jgi:alpha-1,3-rhamnosyl/mannosyltransferase